MCGIAGIIDFSGKPVRESLVADITRALKHRGDDAHGVEVFKTAGLGHQRLSIIDLSNRANQPFFSDDKRYCIVFNGEVYNFRELRKSMSHLRNFKTDSDTEVLLYGLIHYGPKFLERTNGMFAFALWDNERRSLFCARDRFGVKPFFYSLTGTGIVFASEIKALMRHSGISKKVDGKAVSDFFSLGYITGDKTIFEQVKKLLPACFLQLDSNGLQITEYWDIRRYFAGTVGDSPSQRRELLVEGLREAVRKRLVSDVPVGVLLSGGIDSSAVLKLTKGFSQSVSSFSLGFNQASFNELDRAKHFAGAIGSDWKGIMFTVPDERFLSHLAGVYDQPFADTSAVAMFQLCEFTARHQKVVLSGDGGDEMFGGYETCRADIIARLGRRCIPGWSSLLNFSGKLLRLFPADMGKVSLNYKMRQFFENASLQECPAHYSWRLLFNEDEKKALLSPEILDKIKDYTPFHEFERWYKKCAALQPDQRHAIVDIKTWMADDILFKVDMASMAHGLEVRNPFLDIDLFSLAAGIPFSEKAGILRTKKILRTSLGRLLPEYVVSGSKEGFASPVSYWLVNDLAPLFEEVVEDDVIGSFISGKNLLKRFYKEHREGKRDHGYRLWAVLMFGLWARQYLDQVIS
jgi:asparagine synthase (glutamine-hydrolysing)